MGVRKLVYAAVEAVLTVSIVGSAGLLWMLLQRGGAPLLLSFLVKEEDNSVGSVGCVGKSQKSPEISQ